MLYMCTHMATVGVKGLNCDVIALDLGAVSLITHATQHVAQNRETAHLLRYRAYNARLLLDFVPVFVCGHSVSERRDLSASFGFRPLNCRRMIGQINEYNIQLSDTNVWSFTNAPQL